MNSPKKKKAVFVIKEALKRDMPVKTIYVDSQNSIFN